MRKIKKPLWQDLWWIEQRNCQHCGAHHYIDLEEMVNMAIKVERQLKKKTVSRFSSGSSSSWKPRWGNEKRDGTTSRFQSEPPKPKEDSAFKPKPKTFFLDKVSILTKKLQKHRGIPQRSKEDRPS